MFTTAPPQSNRARLADWLERWLRRSVVWGSRGLLISSVFLIGYLIFGRVLTVIGSVWAPSAYLTVTGDPGFILLATLVSLIVVQVTTSLILYRFLVGVKTHRSQVALILSYVGMGFGASALQFLTAPCLAVLSSWL